MASAAKIADNGLNVERHATVRNDWIIAVVLEEKPVRHAAGPWQPRASGIEGADTVNETICGEVGMAADDEFGVGSSEQLPELPIGDARIDPRAIVGTG